MNKETQIQILLQKGFKEVNDGGEVYLQFLDDRDNYFESSYLYTEEGKGSILSVKASGTSKKLTEAQIFEYIENSGGKENIRISELRELGFTLSPAKDGYSLTYFFDTNDAYSKYLQTEDFKLTDLGQDTEVKVLNNVNQEKTGYQFLTINQIKKLIERGGF